MTDSLEAAAQALYARLRPALGEVLPWSSLPWADKRQWMDDADVVLSVYQDYERRGV